MLLREEDVKVVENVIEAFRSRTLDVAKDADRIAHAISVAQAHQDNPQLCSSVLPTALKVGDAVCFTYHQPDVNEPWRFGVVEKFNSGCWVVFTFNIKRKRDRKTEKIVKDGPSFRQYDLAKMADTRRVCRPAVVSIAPSVAEDLAHFGQAVRDLMDQWAPKKHRQEQAGG